MSHDQKVMMLLPAMEKCPMNFYQGVGFCCPNLITVAPRLVTRDKEICQSHLNMKWWRQ